MTKDAVIISFSSTAILESFKKRLILIFSSFGIKPIVLGRVLDKGFFQAHSESVYDTSYASGLGIKGLVGYMLDQIYVALVLLRLDKKNYYFHMSQTLLVPIVALKIRKMFDDQISIILLPGGLSSIYYAKKRNRWASIVRLMEDVGFTLADKLILYSPRILSDWNLERYRNKVEFAYDHFLDLQVFRKIKSVPERDDIVGYVGRLSEEKGVVPFLNSLTPILSKNKNLKIMICGEGELMEYTTIEIKALNVEFNNRIKLVGFVKHDDLPDYLNEMKVLVLPSYSEGLPNIMLEAMACGTPVLATPVGSIPDVISDGITGFIMENNSPECISENINRIVGLPELDSISEGGIRYIGANFTFDDVVARWKSILA